MATENSGVAEVRVDNVMVTGESNWWGDANGPRVEEVNGGALDAEPFLTTDHRLGR